MKRIRRAILIFLFCLAIGRTADYVIKTTVSPSLAVEQALADGSVYAQTVNRVDYYGVSMVAGVVLAGGYLGYTHKKEEEDEEI